jgi:hypothetical protein
VSASDIVHGVAAHWVQRAQVQQLRGKTRDRADMIVTGRATLYYSRGEITNWPGTLRIPVTDSHSGKGYGFGDSYEVVTGHFMGPDDKRWAFRNAGDNQIARCKRMKHQSKG